MKLKILYTALIYCTLVMSCSSKHKTEIQNNFYLKPVYAKGFYIIEDNEYYFLRIINPSDTTEILQEVKLKKDEMTKKHKIACLSTTHLAFCDKLQHIGDVCGIPDTTTYNNINILRKIKNNPTIITLANSLKTEKILSICPDILTLVEFQKSNFLILEQAGILCVPILDYLETHPLGRTEWLKLFGFFFNESNFANKVCDSIFEAYNNLAISATKNDKQPTIFDCSEYAGYWYASGGNSYIATFYKDAGFNYIYSNDKHVGSFPVSRETALFNGSSTEFWRIILPSNSKITVKNIINQNKLYSSFAAVKNGNIILCNPTESQYYIEDILEPEIVLADLINCKKGLDSSNKYYKLLK